MVAFSLLISKHANGMRLGYTIAKQQSRADFLAGQYFDIRLEVHQPRNGSEFIGLPLDEQFTFTLGKKGEEAKPVTEFFNLEEPKLEKWNFTWYEDLFARDAKKPSLVNVAAKAYRRIALYEPGEYTATLSYNNGSKTEATWLVRDLAEERKAKNIVLFIGDGMTTNMITGSSPVYAFTCEYNKRSNLHVHSCSFDRPQADQWQIPIHHGHGQVPCRWSPDDPLDR